MGKEGNKLKKKKYAFALLSTLVSAGLLFGCNPGTDEEEPDPTEEPSEQIEQDMEQEDMEKDMDKDTDTDTDKNE